MFQKSKIVIRQCRIFYLAGFLLISGLKYISRTSGADELKWILTPTARWVSILSGIPFFYAPQTGYVNHSFKFIIAPSCCGISFLLICIATLLYSYIHRLKSARQRCFWLLWCVGFSYLYTILINGFRILISIYLPLYLRRTAFFDRVMSPETLHTAIGTVVYFSSLLGIYAIFGALSQRLADAPAKKTSGGRKWLPPFLWYFTIVLGIPALSRLCRRDWNGFLAYALLVLAICLIILILHGLASCLGMHMQRGKKIKFLSSLCKTENEKPF